MNDLTLAGKKINEEMSATIKAASEKAIDTLNAKTRETYEKILESYPQVKVILGPKVDLEKLVIKYESGAVYFINEEDVPSTHAGCPLCVAGIPH